MKVLLTGASGMIGSHMLKYLLENTSNDIICVCGWEHKGEPHKVLWAIEGYKERVKIITHDLSKPFTARTKREIGQVDFILNIASDSHVDRSITEPVDFIQNNVNLAINMLELAREIKPKLFLQFSTDEVYGVAPEGIDHKEWSPIVPSNPYSASKAAQEAIAISYWRTYGVPLVITNTMNVFSEHQDWEKFIPLVVQRVLSGEEIQVHSYPGAIKAGSRFYIHADSVCDAVMFIMARSAKLYPEAERPDRYNIVGDMEVNNEALVNLVGDILEKQPNYRLVDFHSSRPGHDTRYALDGSKLAEMGWQPEKNFGASFREVVLKLKERLLAENSL